CPLTLLDPFRVVLLFAELLSTWRGFRSEESPTPSRRAFPGSPDGARLPHQITAKVAEDLYTAVAPAFVVGDVPRARPQTDGNLEVIAARVGAVEVKFHLDVVGPPRQSEPREGVISRRLVGAVLAAEADTDAAWHALEQFPTNVLDEAAQLVG